MSHDYAREKFWQAVDVLATSDSSIQERLASAATYLIRLNPHEDLLEEYRSEFDAIRHELTKELATGNEGTISATLRKLSSEEGRVLAGRIFYFYTKLLGGL